MFSKYLRVLGRIKQEHLYVKSSPLRAALKPDRCAGWEMKEMEELDFRGFTNPTEIHKAVKMHKSSFWGARAAGGGIGEPGDCRPRKNLLRA